MKYVGDLEKRVRRFGETCSAKTLEIWRNVVGNLEKLVRQNTLEIWRNMIGAVMVISYWSSLWNSLELGDCKWRLDHNGEIMESNYGDKNFIHHGAENTYLEHFKDRNV